MYKKLLVPLDRSPLSENALGHALDIARAVNGSIDLVLVHQPDNVDGFAHDDWNPHIWELEAHYLEEVAAEIKTGSPVSVTFSHLRGNIADAIINHAREAKLDLIVMSSHGRTGLRREWLGSVADALVRHADCPVLMFRAPGAGARRRAGRPHFKEILATVDGSAESKGVLRPACELAEMMHASVTILQVIQPVPLLTFDAAGGFEYGFPPLVQDDVATEKLAADVRAQLTHLADSLATAEVKVTAKVLVNGAVSGAIIDYCQANAIDCIAMASHGRGMSRLLLGSVADKVVRGSPLPVLISHTQKVASPKSEPLMEQIRTAAVF